MLANQACEDCALLLPSARNECAELHVLGKPIQHRILRVTVSELNGPPREQTKKVTADESTKAFIGRKEIVDRSRGKEG
jgi:hypothetical protein